MLNVEYSCYFSAIVFLYFNTDELEKISTDSFNCYKLFACLIISVFGGEIFNVFE